MYNFNWPKPNYKEKEIMEEKVEGLVDPFGNGDKVMVIVGFYCIIEAFQHQLAGCMTLLTQVTEVSDNWWVLWHC